jgi:ABC-type amino acid transport substrate-binding protein
MPRPLLPRLLPLLCAAACGLPRDAEGTLERVRGGTLRVGMVVDTPWVTDSAGVAGGVEGALARGLAARLRARPHWVRAPEATLMESLKNRDLDLVVGGVTAKSPYATEVGFTHPYYTDTRHGKKHVVAVAPGENAFLLEVDRFLDARRDSIPTLLRAAAP